MSLLFNSHKSQAYSLWNCAGILKKPAFYAALILSYSVSNFAVLAGNLDNPVSINSGRKVAKIQIKPLNIPAPAPVISENNSEIISHDSYPDKPVNPPRGDMPAKNSATPAGKRTVPYEQAASYAAVDNSLQVLPDTLQPTQQEKRDEVVSLAEVSNPKSSFYRSRGMFMDDGNLRNSALNDAARGVGVRAGFSYEAARINALLKSRYQNVLDKRFPFFYLMLGSGRVIPPVIGEANNIQERGGSNFLYLSIGSYEIVKPASLAIREPSWMDYLMLPVSDPRPPEGIQAEGSKELETWKKSVESGWNVGKIEARRTFIANLNRLIRDYKGMQLYHSLAAKGAITIPRVQSIKSNRRVDGDRLFVGEERLEIKVSAKFKR
ncbi:type IV secretion system DotC family protein [Brucella sp. HL-2]|nr:type IV secretion system DotC family protein [Brucella sp. HL-2]MCV9909555.1 type IV secretion system DotC family protein [Brucella sp. HL-2]